MDIFVFGANEAGRHGKGAALCARRYHGAIYGVGEGIQGASYGIPTKDAQLRPLPPAKIEMYVRNFMKFAGDNSHCTFNVTKIGCGLAGFTPEQIAPFFADHHLRFNVKLPPEFLKVLEKENTMDQIEPFDTVDYLDTDAAIIAYLGEFTDDDDAKTLRLALAAVMRALARRAKGCIPFA
jgi:hypothetical protein